MAMNDDSDLTNFLAAFPVGSQEIALELRNWVWDLYPNCNELIYDNYNFLAFGWGPTDRMGDVCLRSPAVVPTKRLHRPDRIGKTAGNT